MRQKGLIVALSVFLVIGLFVGIGVPKTNNIAEAADIEKSSLMVSGNGEIKVKPDVAYINLGVETFDKDANAAQQANAKQMSKIVDALKKLGIDEKSIKTTQYNIYKTYKPVTNNGLYNPKEQNNEEGYNCVNMVQVTINDITKTGTVIDAASKAGANNIYNIRFGIKDQSKYYAEALKKAMTSAKGKADAIAGTIGVTVNKPFKVVENSSGYSPIMYRDTMMMKAENAGYNTPVETGELTISASVSVEYQY